MAQPFILPKDIPIAQYPKPEVFLTEGKRLTEEAQKLGIVMRVMGPLALHYYFPTRSTCMPGSSVSGSATSPTSTTPPTASPAARCATS